MKPYEKNMKSRLGNYYHQSLSSFWDVGTVQSIDAVVMHPCVVKLIGQKSLDAYFFCDKKLGLLLKMTKIFYWWNCCNQKRIFTKFL